MPPLTVVTVVEPGYGRLLSEPAEEQHRGVGGETIREHVDDLRVADELERDQPQRALDVVVADGVLVALDRREHKVSDLSELGERLGDVMRLGQVERCAAHSASEFSRDRLGPCCVASVDQNIITSLGERAGKLAPDARRAADDKGLLCHRPPPLLTVPTGRAVNQTAWAGSTPLLHRR